MLPQAASKKHHDELVRRRKALERAERRRRRAGAEAGASDEPILRSNELLAFDAEQRAALLRRDAHLARMRAARRGQHGR